MTDLDATLMRLELEFPKFKLVYKDSSWLMHFISAFLRVITLGKMSSFMDKFITTIGFVVYVPSDWAVYSSTQRIIILRHESVHMRQRLKYGMFLFTLLYVLLPLPGGLAYFRAKFEKEAYEETILAMCQLYITGPAIVQTESFKRSVIGHFTSAEYFWMWPFKKSLDTWYEEAVRKAIATCSCGARY